MTADTAVHGHGHAAPGHQAEEGLSRGMAGMALFIASEIMLFGGLFAAYFYVRSQAAVWPPNILDLETLQSHEVHTVNVTMGGALTLLLILSGLAAHAGVVALRGGVLGMTESSGVKVKNQTGLLIALGVAIVMGTVFIIGQAYEWLSLMDEGLTAKSNVYGGTFYIMTGFHGAHVIAGLAMLGVAFARGLYSDFTPKRRTYVDASVLYWHFVDVVWVFLYVIVYLT